MTIAQLKHSNILVPALIVGILSTTGCSSGLFKPVQPWYQNQGTGQIPIGNRTQPPSLEIQNTVRNLDSTSQNGIVSQPVVNQNSPASINPKAMFRATPRSENLPDSLNSQVANRFADVPVRESEPQVSDNVNGRRIDIQSPSQPVFREATTTVPVRTTANPSVPQFESSPSMPSYEMNSRRPSSGLASPLFLGEENPAAAQPSATSSSNSNTSYYRFQSPQETIRIPSSASSNGGVTQTAAQFPELQNGNVQASPFLVPTIDTGSPNELNPIVPPNAPAGSVTFPLNYADLDIYVSETSTGRINFGGAYNSDSGLVGQFVVDERNFDILRLPRSFREIVDGTAWRGAGQNFRLELVPGSDVERYLVSFSEPFLFGSRISFSTSLYYFQRQFFDYDEERLGGRFAFGYRLTPDISVSTGIRLENVEVSDPRNATSPTLNAALGDTDLYVGNVSLVRDTRDHPFLPTEGNYLSLTFSQGFGEFDYSRGDIDFRTYRLMYQRPDSSGRHTLSYGTRLGFSGSQTPIFENYFAGGFSTLRGFDFRGASPIEGDIRVGGEFQWLNTVEYTFPLTADDMVKGVLFTDFGTVEDNIEIDSDNFRVAPGFGFRVHLPAAGIGAPLAFDFAFPVSEAAGDDEEVFSFYLGVSR